MEQLENIPRTLQERLRAKKVIPFVGAGVSMAVRERDIGQRLFTSWRELLERAAERLSEEKKDVHAGIVRNLLALNKPEEYLEAARRAREELGAVWYEFLKEQIDHRRDSADNESLNLAREVWELGSSLLITTNYDRVLHWTCPQPNDLCTWDIQAPAEQLEAIRGGQRRPTIWHLHGYIDNAAELILTPDSYHRLYPTAENAQVRYEAALTTLRTKLTSHSFLFIGFSLDDAQFGLQLRGLHDIYEGAPGPHYALVRQADRDRVEALGMPVELITFADFGEPLRACLQTLGKIANGTEDAVEIKEPQQTKDEPIPRPSFDPRNPVFFVPFRAKGDQVIGREDALNAVRKQLTSGRRTVIGQTAAFQGLGGLGKTQLAVEYAYRFKDEYPNGVIWLNADQDIEAQLTDLAEKARWVAPESEHKYKFEIARHRLRTYSDCLLIFDNLEDQQAIADYLPEPQADPHILVTSRSEQLNFEAIPLDVLDEQLSLKLLLQESGRAPENEAELNAAQTIADKLGGLPLALELAGAYLRHRPVSYRQYHDLLEQNLKAALPARFLGGSFTKHETDLYSTLKIDDEILREEPRLREILDLLTWSGSAPMGLSLMCALLDIQDPTDLTNALGLGAALRLLQKTPDAESYALHRLVREVRREDIPLSERQHWVDAVCLRAGDWFQARRQEFADLPQFEAEIDHLQTWQQHAAKYAPSHASRLMWLQAYPPDHRGRYQEAHELVKLALNLFEETEQADWGLKAHLLHDLGITFDDIGDYKKALEYGADALKIRNSLYGEMHLDTAASLDAVGTGYARLGEYADALTYLDESLRIRRELLGQLHPDIASSLISITYIYRELRKYKQQLKYAELALSTRKELLGENHPNTAESLLAVGSAYRNLKKYDQALAYYSKALLIVQEQLGDKHPSLSVYISGLGLCYGALGDHRRELKYHEEALSRNKELLGEDHPNTVLSLSNISYCYQALGDNDKALEYGKKTLELHRTILGDRHPDTIHSANDVASTLVQLARREQAVQLLDEFLHKLPKDHIHFDLLKQHRQALLAKPLRAGFRQPPNQQKQRKKRHKKRR